MRGFFIMYRLITLYKHTTIHLQGSHASVHTFYGIPSLFIPSKLKMSYMALYDDFPV